MKLDPIAVSRRRLFTKLTRVMRLTAFCLLAGLLQVHATGTSQTVSFSGNDIPIQKVFSAIERQTGYVFFYNAALVEDLKPVSVHLVGVPLDEALKQALKGLPLEYGIENKTIVISRRIEVRTEPVIVFPPPDTLRIIRGRIVDTSYTPLQGASVIVLGEKQGTQTDRNGNFALRVKSNNPVLAISYLGYSTREIQWSVNTPITTVMMHRTSDPLDAVQVIAYGTNTRRFSVGSISTVTSEDIEKQPVTNVLLALDGRVPGLTVTSVSGAPGTLVQVQVRGQNTLGSTPTSSPFDQPLFIVDGVPYAQQNNNPSLMYNTFGGTQGQNNNWISPLNSINPSDIESVTVLKDADATSIYGSQGANGVIVITTKKGKAGATTLDVHVNTGPNKITRQLQMLNTPQYLQIRRQAMVNDGIDYNTAPSYIQSDFADLYQFDTTKYTNFAKEFFNGTSNNTDVHASVSGGSQNTTFIVSGGYTRSVYDFPGNFADNRLTMHSGFHHGSQNRRLNIDFGSDFSNDHNNSSNAGPSLGQAMLLPPDLPNLLGPSGNLIWSYNGIDLYNFQMLAYLQQPAEIQNYTFNNTMRISYLVLNGLSVSAGLGYSMSTFREQSATPLSSQDPTQYPTASATFGNGISQSISIEPQADYKHTFGKGVLSLLAGASYKKNSSSYSSLSGTGYTDDSFLGSIEGAQTVTAQDGSTIYKYDGAYGRLGYIYNQRYIVNLTGRRDGSSNFGPGRQFGNFGSAGLGWIFSEERAFKQALPFVSYAKIAGNYGTNGSDAVGSYLYQPFWGIQDPYTAPLFQGTRPYKPLNLYNPDYSWASKHAINLSLDLGFVHDRLLINITGYRNRTSNQLTSYPLPTQTGFRNVVENMNATLQDGGLEMTVTSTNIRTRNFRWTTSFNISGNRNKLIAFPGLAQSPYNSTYTIGKPTTQIFGYRYKGVNPATGIFEYSTAHGDTALPNYGPIASGGDMINLGDLAPKYFGGLSNSFSYKGWSLSFFFHFVRQTGLNYLAGVYQTATPGSNRNLPAEISGFWQKPGDKAIFERLTTGQDAMNALGAEASQAASYFGNSSGAYSNASYIRLQNLSLAYSIPTSYLRKIGAKSCSLYINVQNLLTITSYKFGDPAMPGNLYTVPLQRIAAGGISIDF